MFTIIPSNKQTQNTRNIKSIEFHHLTTINSNSKHLLYYREKRKQQQENKIDLNYYY